MILLYILYSLLLLYIPPSRHCWISLRWARRQSCRRHRVCLPSLVSVSSAATTTPNFPLWSWAMTSFPAEVLVAAGACALWPSDVAARRICERRERRWSETERRKTSTLNTPRNLQWTEFVTVNFSQHWFQKTIKNNITSYAPTVFSTDRFSLNRFPRC